MIHFSCDRCHKIIDPAVDLRYVVRIEILVATPASESDDATDGDHLEQIEELLSSLDPEECDQLSQDVYRRQRFDLCADCRRAFVKNPLGTDAFTAVQFSKN